MVNYMDVNIAIATVEFNDMAYGCTKKLHFHGVFELCPKS